jgi:chorismate mutase
MPSQDQNLIALRRQIDEVDAGILNLLDRRMRLAQSISAAKKKTGKEVFDPERERDLLGKLIEMNQATVVPDERILEIWGKIIELSRDTQNLG